MAKYLLSVHSGDSGPRRPMTDDEMQESFRQISAIESEMN
jgi:hypothetical protein